MTKASRFTTIEFLIHAAGLILFALLSHKYQVVAIGLIILMGYLLYRRVAFQGEAAKLFGFSPFKLTTKTFLYLFLGILLGLSYSLLYRHHLGLSFIPEHIYAFAIVAMGIGAAEELIFRGYLQGLVGNYGPIVASLLATVAHTGYKLSLFVVVPFAVDIDLFFLAQWTFLAGLFFSALREVAKNVTPSLLAHVVFDFMVYGSSQNAPWWIWN